MLFCGDRWARRVKSGSPGPREEEAGGGRETGWGTSPLCLRFPLANEMSQSNIMYAVETVVKASFQSIVRLGKHSMREYV